MNYKALTKYKLEEFFNNPERYPDYDMGSLLYSICRKLYPEKKQELKILWDMEDKSFYNALCEILIEDSNE